MILVLCLDFQFMMIVFLATARDVRSNILFVLFRWIMDVDVSPRIHKGKERDVTNVKYFRETCCELFPKMFYWCTVPEGMSVCVRCIYSAISAVRCGESHF